jgi:antitoxin component of RelBE/YafQ-DinJ toxin-antitoxin module
MRARFHKIITFRVSETTYEKLTTLQSKTGLDMADLCRLGVDYVLALPQFDIFLSEDRTEKPQQKTTTKKGK